MNIWASRCRYSSTVDNHAFSKSLLLPKTSFALRPNPTETEARYRDRTCTDLYKWQSKNLEAPRFILHDGPPYANGDLHMGHAMNKILKDIINRFHVSRGWRVQYIPGWDCHGLPIENKALNELGEDSASLPPLAIRRAAHQTALREIATQREQFKRLGIMADWKFFRDVVENGLIFRRYRPVHFSPSSRSALAEAELVYKDDHVSHSVFVVFKLRAEDAPVFRSHDLVGQDIELLVWTTTPWTLTANMAIAVHPDLAYAVIRRTGADLPLLVVAKDRLEALGSIIGEADIVAEMQGAELVGTLYTPIFASLCPTVQPLKVIPARHVTAASGTGLVHCAPAHGVEDYNAFQDLGLLSRKEEIVCHVGGAGEFTGQVTETVGDAGTVLIGESVLEGGSRKVVELLKQVGALVKIQRTKHRYPYDWRTDKPIIVTATSQWFANLDDIKADALAGASKCLVLPSCLASGGVPIPALYHIPTDTAVLDSPTLEHILGVLDKKGIEYWWEGPVEEFVPPALQDGGVPVNEAWRKGTDTMDVWFDSGTSWSMLDERGDGVPRADVCLEGSDQHRGWFQSQLLTAVASSPPTQRVVSPYATLITHGMVLDQTGKKMSKSLGNVTSPMTVVDGGVDRKKEPVYGADVLRFWVASVDYWNDAYLGPVVLAQAAEGVRKIRNTARFILGNIGSVETRARMTRVKQSEMPLVERYIMHELRVLEQTALEGYSQFNFAKVTAALSNFVNITLSSFYFDISKDGLYANALDSFERRATVTVLEQVLTTMNSIMAPLVPHLAEEIHEAFNETESSIFMSRWEPLTAEWDDPKANEEMKMLLRLRTVVLAGLEEARGDKKIKGSLEAEIELLVPELEELPPFMELLQREENLLKTLFITSDTTLIDEGSLGTSSPEWVYISSMAIPACEEELTIRMSTTLPPRRAAGRTTRTTALKDNENANARPSRLNTRAKPLAVNSAAAANVTTRATATTAASRAKVGLGATSDAKPDVPAAKRKRDAQGENTTLASTKTKNQTTKGKEKESAVKKEKLDPATGKPTTVRTTRQPLRTVRSINVVADEPEPEPPLDVKVDVKDELHVDENAMLVDLPSQPALAVAPVRKSLVAGEHTAAAPRHPTAGARRPSTRSIAQLPEDEIDEDDDRAHKRRRTSPDPPEEEEDPAALEEARLQAEEELIAARIAAELEAYANDEPEADPETSPWDDLDADDADDPVMVSEYVVDIFKYLKQLELTTMPNPNYMASQTELAWKMRGVLNDWLIQLHVRFRLLPETLFLAINIIDRFLSARVVSLAKLQLVGVTCMFIAAKFEEIADSSYTEAEILQAERYVLKTLDWNMSYPSPVHYLRRISKADDYNLKARTLGKYLIEIACLEWRLIAAPPSLLAAAAIWLARIALGEENWTPNLAHYSSYPESALLPTANLMLNYILKPSRHESFHLKYSGKKFSKASVYMRQWALERWDENTLVDLAAELASLKTEIRAERVHEQVRMEQEQLRRDQEEAERTAERAERRLRVRDSVALATGLGGRPSTQRTGSGSNAGLTRAAR
ncbi:hypothetical protein MSAN_01715600 [Mycena sanguinolenta]|uniref:isoleucine--tRNA ligase n=1 Tax=Mycena sanguinolenta TaxID=230812 RepID=A0A8H6XZ74_9AGAR|nr:hypothetical protein MSAN_01715600 [Mycena sanguinolenta]